MLSFKPVCHQIIYWSLKGECQTWTPRSHGILLAQLRQVAAYFNPEVSRLHKCKLLSAANLQPALRTSHKHLLNLPESIRVSCQGLNKSGCGKRMRNVALFLFILSSVKHMLLRGKIRVKTRLLSVSFGSETSCGYTFICMGQTGITILAFTGNDMESCFFRLVKTRSGLSQSSLAAPRHLWVLRWQMQSVLSASNHRAPLRTAKSNQAS